MRENFVELLSPLADKDVWSDEDRENVERYARLCPETTAMQRILARLESIVPHLHPLVDEQHRDKLQSQINQFVDKLRKFKTKLVKVARKIALSDIDAEPARKRAFEYFNRFDLDTAEFYADISASRFAEFGGLSYNAVNFADTEEEWDKHIEGLRVEPPDRWMMNEFFQNISGEFYSAAYAAHKKMNASNGQDLVAAATAFRYYQASMNAWPQVENMTAYGFFLQSTQMFVEAADVYRDVLDKFEPEIIVPDLLRLYDFLGMIEVDNDLYDRARKTLFAAVELLRKVVPDNAQLYRPYLGKALNRLGRTLFRLKEDAAAKDYLLEALKINRELLKIDPFTFEPQVMEGLGDLAYLESREKNFDATEKYFLEAIGLARKLAGEDAYFKERLGFFLTAMALTHEEMLDIAAAERGHDEGWELFHDLATENPKRFAKDLAQRSAIRADFFRRYVPDKRETAIWDAADAFALAVAFPDDDAAIGIALRAKETLETLELDSDEIAHRISFQEAVREEMLKKIKGEI
jgi:hypothetical protein